jgi:hypothetical protein
MHYDSMSVLGDTGPDNDHSEPHAHRVEQFSRDDYVALRVIAPSSDVLAHWHV